MVGLLGKKLGMTHIFNEEGKIVPVTVIEAGPCYVTQLKTRDSDGYDAIQLGFGSKRDKLVNKAQLSKFKKVGIASVRYLREIRVRDIANYRVGQKIEADLFAKGDFVDVTGVTIGKGFQGGVKRWGWAGGDQGHGSMFHRAIGSIQSGPRLSRVTKGHPMAGHMGVDKKTIQNLEVVKSDKENGVLVVRGPVPGHTNGLLIIKEARKMPKGFVKHKPVHVAIKKKGVKAQTAAAKK